MPALSLHLANTHYLVRRQPTHKQSPLREPDQNADTHAHMKLATRWLFLGLVIVYTRPIHHLNPKLLDPYRPPQS
jgi:hypothetical protein